VSLASTPDLTSFDWIVLNSSAGKDSLAMLVAVVREADRQGVRGRLVVVHCDLGRVEWPGTRELAERQAKWLGLRFEVVQREQDLLDHVSKRELWPDPARRYCTSDHKTSQVAKLLTRLAAESRAAGVARPVRLLSCLGIRAQESPARAKKVVLSVDSGTTGKGRVKRVERWLPIHAWSVDRVWASIRESGAEAAGLVHDAYTKHGMPRLSCVFCIFSPREALVRAGKANPELLAEYVALEQRIGHRFTERLSLAEVQASVLAGKEVGAVRDWTM
jgi:3'-phosphoadenosine 5'-phosphosulfate sulfotransferase (PAPS reductase)/FAD synthetase